MKNFIGNIIGIFILMAIIYSGMILATYQIINHPQEVSYYSGE